MIRLPAIGFTLPWQLVAAHEPGPMYLLGCVCAERKTGSAMNETQKTTRCMQELKVTRIRIVESLFAYIVRRGRKSTGRVVFFGPGREKPQWSKRKEVTPKFTLPALRSGGR